VCHGVAVALAMVIILGAGTVDARPGESQIQVLLEPDGTGKSQSQSALPASFSSMRSRLERTMSLGPK
jgi:hypothetical protein